MIGLALAAVRAAPWMQESEPLGWLRILRGAFGDPATDFTYALVAGALVAIYWVGKPRR